MKLSVVIPAYNAADFIEKSYHSIINQDLQDFEIIYVNNNSTDATCDEIHKLLEKDNRIQLLHQPKQGAATARNMGIQAAEGDYIYVFDVDDEIYPSALNSMIKILDSYEEVDAVFGKMVKSYQEISKTPKPTDDTGHLVFKQKPYWGLHWFSNLKDVVGPPAFLYKKRVFDKIGYYNEAIRNNEDTAFDIKLGMTCNVVFFNKYVYLYFKHESSTIQTSKREMPRAFMIWPRLVKEHLPFYLNQTLPKKFEELLFAQLFQSMGRQLEYTNGLSKRFQLKKELLSQVESIRVPLIIRVYLVILALLPFSYVRKVYSYYVVPNVVKHIHPNKV